MIDPPFEDRLGRSPDLRLGDVRTRIFRKAAPFEHRIFEPERGMFVYARRGVFTLEIEGAARSPVIIQEGTAVGFESGRAQIWRSGLTPRKVYKGEVISELFIGSIPRRMGVLQRLSDGFIIVPPDAEPFARIIRHVVEVHYCELQNPLSEQDEGIIRRCAEICMIEFVRYARSMNTQNPKMPEGLRHDEHLLRAWSAYFVEPRRRWTVKALADAAGLGRTAFAERFNAVFGTPPLQTLTMLRLEQAKEMLRQSKAPLIEIAITIGYNSEAAFVRAFRRQYGLPPGRFRSQHSS